MNKSKITRFLSLSLAIAAFILIGGNFAESRAQIRDPFKKLERGKKTTTTTSTTSTTTTTKPQKPVTPAIIVVNAPPIEQRIEYYKRLREMAASNGQEIPKVTSVLTIDEMSVTGIFRTPRGFAAMVEAKPIKLSYTIYPGEKFFDGQLVAIEENRLVFRRVTKMSNNKFVASVENKTLRQYSDQEVVQGTAPVQASTQTTQTNQSEIVAGGNTSTTTETSAQTTTVNPAVTSGVVVSPLDEMNRQQQQEQQTTSTTQTNKRQTKKPKVAKKSK